MNISAISTNRYYRNNTPSATTAKPQPTTTNPAFSGLGNGIAKAEAKIMQQNWFSKLVTNTAKSKSDVIKHLTTINALIISGTYMARTATNKKLEKDKRRTLVINQGCVATISTVAGYTLSKKLNNKIDQFTDNIRAANYTKFAQDAAKELGKNVNDKAVIKKVGDKFGNFNGGIKAASSLMIFGLIYRYISPVIVTPIANKIGNMIDDKKAAQKAQ